MCALYVIQTMYIIFELLQKKTNRVFGTLIIVTFRVYRHQLIQVDVNYFL